MHHTIRGYYSHVASNESVSKKYTHCQGHVAKPRFKIPNSEIPSTVPFIPGFRIIDVSKFLIAQN